MVNPKVVIIAHLDGNLRCSHHRWCGAWHIQSFFLNGGGFGFGSRQEVGCLDFGREYYWPPWTWFFEVVNDLIFKYKVACAQNS